MMARVRLTACILVAVLLHALVLWLWPAAEPCCEAPAAPGLQVSIQRESREIPSPEPESEPRPEAVRRDEPGRAVASSPDASMQPEGEPIAPTESSSESAPPPAPGADIVGRLSRFRLDGPSDLGALALPSETTVPGGPTARFGPTLAQVLDTGPVALPFDAPDERFVFYPFGVRGDLARLGDAITREFGFRTPGGMEIRCAWIVVMVACAWK